MQRVISVVYIKQYNDEYTTKIFQPLALISFFFGTN